MELRFILPSFVFFSFLVQAGAQTCCSGGVPLTGNLGMPATNKGTWQLAPAYDLNYLSTLKTGKLRLEESARQRMTQSILVESGYSLTDNFFISTLFTYVFQSRTIKGEGGDSRDFLHGVGDAVLLLTYRMGGGMDQKWEFLLGAGPKIPLGRSDMTRADGISYNVDLQPGSGAWDGIFWGLLSRQGLYRPASNLSLRIIYRYTGTNNDYLGFTDYRFGNEWQLIAGLSDQVLISNQLFNPSIMLRFRYSGPDYLGGSELSNTGGKWIFLVPGVVWQAAPGFHARLAAEIPVYSYLKGTQLTTDFRLTAGLYFRIKGRRNSIINQ